MKRKYEVVTIVVTYNRKKLLSECIKALNHQTYKKNLIIIIDNNSSDGTDEFIKPMLQENVIYEKLKNNLGGAGGFNYGIKKALQYNPKNIWLMDDDTIPKTDALENLLKASKLLKNEYSYLSSRVLWSNNKVCNINKQTFDKNFLEDYELVSKGILKIRTASFVSCLVNKSAILEVGLPIKEFFIWGDDTEYTERLSNYKSAYYVNDSVVIHKSVENSLPSIEDDKRELERFKYLYRNLYYIYKKTNRLDKYRRLRKMHIKNILKKAKNKRIKRIMIIIISGIRGRFFNPKIEYIDETKNINT